MLRLSREEVLLPRLPGRSITPGEKRLMDSILVGVRIPERTILVPGTVTRPGKTGKDGCSCQDTVFIQSVSRICTSLFRILLFRFFLRKHEHQHTKDQQCQSQPEVYVNVQRFLVEFCVSYCCQSLDCQDQAEKGEHQTNWNFNIESHIIFFILPEQNAQNGYHQHHDDSQELGFPEPFLSLLPVPWSEGIDQSGEFRIVLLLFCQQ